jgi:hypothetical protein
LTFNTHQLTEHLLDTAGTGLWGYAPKQVIDAQASADRAYTDLLNAQSAVDDAEHELFLKQAEFDLEGRNAVRDNKPLPSRDAIDRARFTLDNARADLKQAEASLRLERGNLANLLNDEATREAWRKSLTAQANKIRNEIADLARQVAPKQAELTRALSATHYLGAWGQHATLPAVSDANPTVALMALAQAEPWKPAQGIDTATRYATQTEADTRPAVWLVNAGGAVHKVSAETADKALTEAGFRPATEAEIINELRRQGLTPAQI